MKKLIMVKRSTRAVMAEQGNTESENVPTCAGHLSSKINRLSLLLVSSKHQDRKGLEEGRVTLKEETGEGKLEGGRRSRDAHSGSSLKKTPREEVALRGLKNRNVRFGLLLLKEIAKNEGGDLQQDEKTRSGSSQGQRRELHQPKANKVVRSSVE